MGRSKRKRRTSKKRTEFWIDGNIQYVKLIKWMQCYTNGTYRHSTKLKPAICKGTGRGLKACKKIEIGEVMVSIPFQLLITKHTVLQSTNIAHVFKNYELSNLELIMLFLICEKYNEESIYKHYIRTLPVDYTNVTFFSMKHIQMLPDNMKVLAASKYRKYLNQCQNLLRLLKKERLHENYQSTLSNKSKSVPQLKLHDLQASDILLNDLFWAHSAINTRSVYFKSNGFGESCENNIALAPFLDLLNHSTRASVEAGFNESTQCYEITTLVAYQKYEEVFIKYGNHDNFKLLIEYGFTIEDNPEEKILFSLDELINAIDKEKDHCLKQKCHVIHQNKLSSGLMCTVDGLSWALWTSLGILLSSFSQLNNWNILLSDSQMTESDPKVKHVAILLIKIKLAEYQQKECLSSTKEDGISCMINYIINHHVYILTSTLHNIIKDE